MELKTNNPVCYFLKMSDSETSEREGAETLRLQHWLM